MSNEINYKPEERIEFGETDGDRFNRILITYIRKRERPLTIWCQAGKSETLYWIDEMLGYALSVAEARQLVDFLNKCLEESV